MNKVYAAFIGFLIACMIAFNGVLASYVGNYLSLVIIHIVGLLVVIGLLIVTKTKVNLKKTTPFYLYVAGALGVMMVLFNNMNFATLGVSLTVALGLFGQSLASGIIDHYGLFGMKKNKFNKQKLFGMALVSAGIITMVLF